MVYYAPLQYIISINNILSTVGSATCVEMYMGYRSLNELYSYIAFLKNLKIF